MGQRSFFELLFLLNTFRCHAPNLFQVVGEVHSMRRARTAGDTISHYVFGDPYNALQHLNLAFFVVALAFRLASLLSLAGRVDDLETAASKRLKPQQQLKHHANTYQTQRFECAAEFVTFGHPSCSPLCLPSSDSCKHLRPKPRLCASPSFSSSPLPLPPPPPPTSRRRLRRRLRRHRCRLTQGLPCTGDGVAESYADAANPLRVTEDLAAAWAAVPSGCFGVERVGPTAAELAALSSAEQAVWANGPYAATAAGETYVAYGGCQPANSAAAVAESCCAEVGFVNVLWALDSDEWVGHLTSFNALLLLVRFFK